MLDPRSFTIAIDSQRLERLKARIIAYDWTAMPDLGGWAAGPPTSYMRALAERWVDGYDWREVEARRNRLPQFLADIDGQTIHYIHIRGSQSDRPPLLLLHGWPGSVFEFEETIEAIRRLDDSFDIIVPAMPGYGFSLPLHRPIGPRGTARLLQSLMRGLGHARFMVQGGDWGSIIGAWIAYDQPEACIGIHLNMIPVHAADVRPETEEELAHAARRAVVNQIDEGYRIVHTTKPQSLCFAMADNPIGVAGWIIDKLASWSDLPRDAHGDPILGARYDLDDVITFVMAYLVTPSFITSTWMYRGRLLENSSAFPAGTRIVPPLAAARFPDPAAPPPPRSIIARTYDIRQWTDFDRGGHFAAMEQPELFATDVVAFYRSLA